MNARIARDRLRRRSAERFESRFDDMVRVGSGKLAQVHCPIGMPGIASKEPEVIAVSVAAQILLTFSEGNAAHRGEM